MQQLHANIFNNKCMHGQWTTSTWTQKTSKFLCGPFNNNNPQSWQSRVFWWLKAKKFLEPTHLHIYIYIKDNDIFMEPPTRVQHYSLPHICFWKLESSLLILHSCAGSMNMHDLDKHAIIWKWKHLKRCNVYDCLLKYLRDKNFKTS